MAISAFRGLIKKFPKRKTSKDGVVKPAEATQMEIPTVGTMPEATRGTPGRLRNLFFGGPKRTVATALTVPLALPFAGAGLGAGVRGYVDLLKNAYGFGEEQEPGISNLELQRGAYSPFGTTQGMSQQDLLATINAFAQGMPAPAGAGGGRRSVYETGSTRARRALGFEPTTTSSLTPMAGGEALAGEALRNQRGSLQDYLNLVTSAANAAGVKLDQASRQQLVNLGLAAYIKDAQRQNELAQQFQFLPPFIVTPQVRAAAEQRVATTPGLTLQDAVNELKQTYLYNLLSQQKR